MSNGPIHHNKRTTPEQNRPATTEEVFEVLKQLLELFPKELTANKFLGSTDFKTISGIPTVGQLQEMHTEIAVRIKDALLNVEAGGREREYLLKIVRDLNNRLSTRGEGEAGSDADGEKS